MSFVDNFGKSVADKMAKKESEIVKALLKKNGLEGMEDAGALAEAGYILIHEKQDDESVKLKLCQVVDTSHFRININPKIEKL